MAKSGGKQLTLYNSQEELEKALKKSQQDPIYHNNKGLPQVNLSQQQQAIERLNQAMELNPQFSRAFQIELMR